MKKIVFIAGLMSLSSVFGQSTFCVDDNAGGSQNGTPSNPYHSIQQAIDVASNGDIVKVAKGMYSEALSISQKKVQLLGGFAGGGDFNTANPQTNVTTIQGTSTKICIDIYMDAGPISGIIIINGFTIRGGQKGIQLGGEYSGFLNNITIENNILENNGMEDIDLRGGAISLEGDNIIVRNNVIRNNKAGRGAAISRTSGNPKNWLIENNVIQNNTGYDDHGGAIFLNGDGLFKHNIVEGNRAAASFNYGWGGGVLFYNYDTTKLITSSHNIYRNNHAPSRGGAVFVDEAGKVLFKNDLFYDNTSDEPGSAIYVDADLDNKPSVAYFENCTVAENTSAQTGCAIFVQASIVTIKNSIFWNNGGDDFELSPDGQAAASLTVNYTLSQENISETGNLSTDPLFANSSAGDYHELSQAGRFNPTTETFVNDATTSPAIDAGNPSSNFSQESTPNGGRINLGCYGNTPEASKGGPVGVNEHEDQNGVVLYPNPTNEWLYIKNFTENMKVELFNNLGQKIDIKINKTGACELGSLAKGTYFLLINTETHKIVVGSKF